MRLGDVLSGLGGPVAYYPKLAPLCGGTTAAIFFCQLAYWHGKQRNAEGWIAKPWHEIEAETGLSRKEQFGSRRQLRAAGLIRERKVGMPQVIEYYLEFDKLQTLWDWRHPASGHIQLPDSAQPNVPVGTLECAGGHTLKGTEITSETTAERKIPASLTRTNALEGFEDFQRIYPRRRDWEDARKAWRKLAPDPSLRARILAAVRVQAASPEWRDDLAQHRGKHIPHPASWLNARRWEDEFDLPGAPSAPPVTRMPADPEFAAMQQRMAEARARRQAERQAAS